ncbi:MAG: hypothetical protein HDR82_05845 [Bacteroides sp.]|nr:hypothetical protein [Bacteroides sp.]
MKKNYFKVAAAGMLVFLMVACGLRFTDITFSSHSIEQFSNLTIDMKLERNGDYQNNDNLYLYLGARVPADWSAVEMTATDVNAIAGPGEPIEFENSEFYAALLELSYPKDGYKWVAFQAKEITANLSGEPLNATITLKAGVSMGDYVIDLMGGASKSTPAELYSNGTINYDLAFNNWGNNNDGLKTINGKKYVSCQEYLFNASTLSKAEIDARAESLDYIDVLCPTDGVRYPITPSDVVNYPNKPNEDAAPDPDFDRTVKVTAAAGIDEVYESSLIDVKAVNGGVEVTANGGVATVYDLAGCILATEYVNGTATIATRPGVCIVRVIEGNRTLVNKVIVK